MSRSSARAAKMLCLSGAVTLLALAFALVDGHPARADGAIVVNNPLDTNLEDSVLTLREAILVANGTLFGAFSDGEKAQLGGCTFTGGGGNWTIAGGCGAGYTNTITFAFTATVITLSSPLTLTGNSRPTLLQGPSDYGAEIVIDGSNLPPGANSLNVLSAGNSISYLTFRRAPAAGIYISGFTNRVSNSRAYGNGGPGIQIDGSYDTLVLDTTLGFRDLDNPNTCNPATRNGGPNILLSAGAALNTIAYATSVCSLSDGVLITGTYSTGNIIDGSYHGTSAGPYFGPNLGNAGAGIAIRSGGKGNFILNNTISYNRDGVVIAGPGSNDTVVERNNIGFLVLNDGQPAIPNTRHGILIDGSVSGAQVLTNTVYANAQSGFVISGTVNNSALVQGNGIDSQGANGILLTGGSSHNTLRGNSIARSGGHGILLTAAAAVNNVSGGVIYNNAGAGIAEGGGADLCKSPFGQVDPRACRCARFAHPRGPNSHESRGSAGPHTHLHTLVG